MAHNLLHFFYILDHTYNSKTNQHFDLSSSLSETALPLRVETGYILEERRQPPESNILL